MSMSDPTCCQKLQQTISRASFAELRELHDQSFSENAAKKLLKKMTSSVGTKHSLTLPRASIPPQLSASDRTPPEEKDGKTKPAMESLLRRLQVLIFPAILPIPSARIDSV